VRRLTDPQIRTLARWVDAGAPEGDPKDLPAPRQVADGWTLGTPDLVLDSGEPFGVPARGKDIYRNFVLPYYSQDDQWVFGDAEEPAEAALQLAPDDFSANLALAVRGVTDAAERLPWAHGSGRRKGADTARRSTFSGPSATCRPASRDCRSSTCGRARGRCRPCSANRTCS
jgi:hypothetical protein